MADYVKNLKLKGSAGCYPRPRQLATQPDAPIAPAVSAIPQADLSPAEP